MRCCRYYVFGGKCEVVVIRGGVSDGSRLAICQTFSSECPSSCCASVCMCMYPLYFMGSLRVSAPYASLLGLVFCFVLFYLLYFCRFCLVEVFMLLLKFCRYSSDIFLSSRPRTELGTPRVLLGFVEARLVNDKNTHTHTHSLIRGFRNKYH